MSGQNLSGCRIDKTFSKGVHSQLYRAFSEELARPVMIKILDPRFPESSKTAQRFLRGGELALRMEHPNIVQTFSAGKEGRVIHMLMAYLEGHSLDRVLEHHKTIPYQTALDITRQIACAMEYAASFQVVHRCIEPSHIMLSPGGRVSMLGFGMARKMEGQDFSITAEGALVGLSPYSCPESGSGIQDIRGDLYSLGCVLYHIIAGRAPFSGRDPLELLHRHRTEEAKPLRSATDPRVPIEVEEIVASLMAKTAEDRIQTPAELIACIDAVIKPEIVGSSVERHSGRLNQTVIVTTRELMAIRRQRTVLVCDPQPYNTQLIHQTLRRLGFRTLTTRDAEAALEAAEKYPVDLLVMDLKLPGMGGVEFLREMHRRLPGMVTLITRGGEGTMSILESSEFGEVHSVERPLNPSVIRAALQELIR